MGKPVPKRQNQILDFNEAGDDGVAVASAGPYANHVHLAPDRLYASTHTTHNRFTALWNLSGKTRVSRYQKNIHPLLSS